jgi:hypothetical protein
MSHELAGIPALSIRQPWAWAILHAGKRIENREWRSCKYRGPILIHASKWGGHQNVDRLSIAAQDEAYAMLAMARRAGSPALAGPVTLRMLYEHRGGIVGRANIVGVVDAQFGETVVEAVRRPLTPTERAWWVGGFGLVLDDVEPLPFTPCKGALGLFRPDITLAGREG